MIIYTRLLVPKGFDAITVWPFIFMRQADPALREHELVHYREQAWVAPLWWARYALSKTFRVQAEVRAYRVQMAHGMSLAAAAMWLQKYDTQMTQAQAVALLTQAA